MRVVLFGAIALIAACSPQTAPLARPHVPGPIWVRQSLLYTPESIRATIQRGIEAQGRQPARTIDSISLEPWAGDADRFTFTGTLHEEVDSEGWTLRANAHGNVDMHTQRVELTGVAAAKSALAGEVSWQGSTVRVMPPVDEPR